MNSNPEDAATKRRCAERVAWSIKRWCDETDLSRSFVYVLIQDQKLDTVKVAGKRLITTAPRDFLASQAGEAA
jgi:hypothetical protein